MAQQSPTAREVTLASHSWLQNQLQPFLADLETMVNMDSGSYDREDVEKVARWLKDRVAAWHVTVHTHDGAPRADSFAVELQGTGSAKIALLAHLDTVFSSGTASERPFRVVGDKATGPGVSDMKAGVLGAVYAIEALRTQGFEHFHWIRLVCTTDEEIGSGNSKEFIERMSSGADAVFVLEGGRENGDIVSQRKGVGSYQLQVRGKPAHAGVGPWKGSSAILALARQTVALHELNDYARGATVNVGVVRGGTRSNVVAEHASAEIDVRANTQDDMEDLLKRMVQALDDALLPGTSYTFSPRQSRPAWGPSSGTARLAHMAGEIAHLLGFDVRAVATGGGSDGNFTAAAGIPTLDGLGPVGGLDHGPDEYAVVSSIIPRTALLAGLIAHVSLCE